MSTSDTFIIKALEEAKDLERHGKPFEPLLQKMLGQVKADTLVVEAWLRSLIIERQANATATPSPSPEQALSPGNAWFINDEGGGQ